MSPEEREAILRRLRRRELWANFWTILIGMIVFSLLVFLVLSLMESAWTDIK